MSLQNSFRISYHGRKLYTTRDSSSSQQEQHADVIAGCAVKNDARSFVPTFPVNTVSAVKHPDVLANLNNGRQNVRYKYKHKVIDSLLVLFVNHCFEDNTGQDVVFK